MEGRGREDMPTSVAEKVSKEPEEGSPEYIRRKYFLSAPADDPSRVVHLYTPALHLFRYHTTLLALLSRLRSVLVTLFGLHHHPEGSYTLDELILLTRSSMSTQRSTILEVLGKENLKYLLLRYASILAKMH